MNQLLVILCSINSISIHASPLRTDLSDRSPEHCTYSGVYVHLCTKTKHKMSITTKPERDIVNDLLQFNYLSTSIITLWSHAYIAPKLWQTWTLCRPLCLCFPPFPVQTDWPDSAARLPLSSALWFSSAGLHYPPFGGSIELGKPTLCAHGAHFLLQNVNSPSIFACPSPCWTGLSLHFTNANVMQMLFCWKAPTKNTKNKALDDTVLI